MRAPLDPFSKVTDEKSRWDPEWYSWLTDLSTSTTQLQAQIVQLQQQIVAQQIINSQQAQDISTLQGAPPTGMILLSSKVGPASSIFFSGINGSIYEAYRFQIIGLKPGNDGATLVMQMSNNNGASWLGAANGWVWTYSDQSTAAGAYSSTAASDAASVWLFNPANSTWGCYVDLTLYPGVTTATLITATWQSVGYHPATSGTRMITGGITEQSNSTPVNAVNFFFGGTAGGITAGRVTMYGIRKS